jgi:hypothetical protein
MPRRIRGIPYRGEVRPKIYGHPSPPKPKDHLVDQIFWFTFILVGIIIFLFALTGLPGWNFGGFFIFAIYLMFLLIAIFAFRDVKQIETITPNDDKQKDQPEDADQPDEQHLFEEYFEKIEWMNRSPNPNPSWLHSSYRIVKAKATHTVKRGNRFFFGSWALVAVLVAVAVLFREFPQIAIASIIIICLTYLGIYLIRD